ncbi:MAG: 50S ribosomal protein L4 [Opitutales bacterium]
MKFRVHTADAASASEKEIDIPVFEGDKGLQALKNVLVAYQANRRQGTRLTKTRAFVARTGKKLFRQKGTGNARHGDRGAPIYVGGGTAHGAKPQDWSKAVNKKEKRLAFARALFDKAQAGKIELIEKFEFSEVKTRAAKELLDKIDADARHVLICDQQWQNTFALSARNLERITLQLANDLNAWDLVRYDKLILTEAAFAVIVNRAQPIAPRVHGLAPAAA